MAQVFVTFGRVDTQRGLPAYAPQGTTNELSTSGTAAATSSTAAKGDFARVVNAGTGVVHIAVGASPTAAVGTTWPLAGGGTLDLGPLAAGDKVSVIDDS